MTDPGHFRLNPHHTASMSDPGPSRGEIAWKTALGRQWYAPPIVHGDRVICGSPGRKGRKLLCLDAATGDLRWEVIGAREPEAGELPARMRVSSRIVDAGDVIYVRPLEHDRIYGISPDDGTVVTSIPGSGSLDYRTHPQPLLVGDDRYLIYPAGTGAGTSPSTGQADSRIWRTIVCHDLAAGVTHWRFQVGQFFSSPAVGEECVYVGTSEGYLYALRLDPPDLDRGGIGNASVQRIAWSFRAGEAINGGIKLCGDVVLFGANDGTVYSLHARTGAVRWKTRVADPEPRAFIQFSRPSVRDGRLMIGSASAEIASLDLQSGEILARIGATDWVRACPVMTADAVLVASIDGLVRCYERSGSASSADEKYDVRWERRINEWHLTCDPVLNGDTVLITTSDMRLWSLDITTGELQWVREIVEYPDDYVAFDEFQSSPALSEGSLYLGTPGHFVAAVDTETGSIRWKYEVGGEVPADPIVADGRVFVGQQGGEGRYFCLDARDGHVLWEQSIGRVWAASSLCDDLLYVPGAEGVAWCINAADGTIVWRKQLASDLYVAPLVWENKVSFGSWDEWLYTFDRFTGRLLWRFHAETYLDSSAPVYMDGAIYLPTMGPRFFCLGAENGNERWRYVPDPVWTTNASPAVAGDRIVMTVFLEGGMPWKPYTIHTRCLNRHTGEEIWSFPAGGLNGPVIAGERVFFASTVRGDHGFYCVDLAGNGDGTTSLLFRVELGFTVLESCVAVTGKRAYAYAEDGYLYAIE